VLLLIPVQKRLKIAAGREKKLITLLMSTFPPAAYKTYIAGGNPII
jgi:hypothetical protein